MILHIHIIQVFIARTSRIKKYLSLWI